MGCLRLRNMLNANKPAFGLWVSLGDPATVEIAAHAGYDYVNIDMEHTALTLEKIENMLRAAAACGISAMVRVPENNAKTILRVAELGPDGIYIPHVKDAEDARQAVIAAKYPPIGDRGTSASTRVARYGLDGADFVGFAERVNRELILFAQIEDKTALDDIENIAAVQGLDVCGMAPSDLSRSLGIMGTKSHPKLGEAIREAAAKVRKVGKAKLAIPIMHSSFELDAPTVIGMGALMISAGSDARTLLRGLTENMKQARAKL